LIETDLIYEADGLPKEDNDAKSLYFRVSSTVLQLSHKTEENNKACCLRGRKSQAKST
jgi:hypothetical protein